jgi:23S rRNA pseudouridine1911/1915/1917 synthase
LASTYNSTVTSSLRVPVATPSWTITERNAGTRLDKFLAAGDRLGSRSRVLDALDKGKIFLNGGEVAARQAGRSLRSGDHVQFWKDRPGSAARRRSSMRAGHVRILFEDDSLLVVNKPAGLLAVPLPGRAHESSAYDDIKSHLLQTRRRPLVVHRIDRDTSGLVVFAKDLRAQSHLKEQFVRHEPERMYWAVVHGHPEPAEGTWRDYLAWDQRVLRQKTTAHRDPRGKEAISHYRVLETLPGAALLEIRLETGKQNQIRIQAQQRGHTLVGEALYAPPSMPETITFSRQALHARRLAFRHPRDGRALEFDAPLPDDMKELLTRLRRTTDATEPR